MTWTHGAGGYRNHHCRCEICRAGKRQEKADQYAALAADPTIRPHGVNNTYVNWGCRCDACYAAHAAENAKRYTSHHRGLRRFKTRPIGREWLDS